MILLVTSVRTALDCATALEEGTGQRVETVSTLGAALRLLRASEYQALVVDQVELDRSPRAADLLLNEAGAAVPVIFNLAICGCRRLVQEVAAALRRRERERAAASQQAARQLRSEMKDTIAGILLSSELALLVPELPQAAQAKLRSVHQLATALNRRLAQSG